jgi:SAM-dependent methyltransferase
MTFWGKLVQCVGRLLYQQYPRRLFTGNAMAHIAPVAARWCKGWGVDFGAGRWPLVGAAPVDLDTALQLDGIRTGSLDYVFSSHCLEHVHDWRGTLHKFQWALRPGGKLFLYLPHESMVLWNAETVWGRAAGHVWTPRLETLVGYATRNGWHVEECRPGPDEYYSWFIVLGREE